MKTTLSQIFVNLLITVIISFLAYKHYKKSTKELHSKYHTFWPRFFSPSIDVVTGTVLVMVM